MKLIISLVLITGIFSNSFAQEKKQPVQNQTTVNLPVDTLSKKITYTEVVKVEGVSKEVLYKRANQWFHTFYKNPPDVIRENNLAEGKILGKARFKIYNPADKNGTKTDAGVIQYSLTVVAKDGRFKYELTDLNWKQPSYYAIEKWTDRESQIYQPVFEDYLSQVDAEVKKIITDLKNTMFTEPVKVDKDNW